MGLPQGWLVSVLGMPGAGAGADWVTGVFGSGGEGGRGVVLREEEGVGAGRVAGVGVGGRVEACEEPVCWALSDGMLGLLSVSRGDCSSRFSVKADILVWSPRWFRVE